VIAIHGGSPNKGIDRPIKVQKQKREFLKGKQCIIEKFDDEITKIMKSTPMGFINQ
jgi:hypothetical protein